MPEKSQRKNSNAVLHLPDARDIDEVNLLTSDSPRSRFYKITHSRVAKAVLLAGGTTASIAAVEIAHEAAKSSPVAVVRNISDYLPSVDSAYADPGLQPGTPPVRTSPEPGYLPPKPIDTSIPHTAPGSVPPVSGSVPPSGGGGGQEMCGTFAGGPSIVCTTKVLEGTNAPVADVPIIVWIDRDGSRKPNGNIWPGVTNINGIAAVDIEGAAGFSDTVCSGEVVETLPKDSFGRPVYEPVQPVDCHVGGIRMVRNWLINRIHFGPAPTPAATPEARPLPTPAEPTKPVAAPQPPVQRREVPVPTPPEVCVNGFPMPKLPEVFAKGPFSIDQARLAEIKKEILCLEVGQAKQDEMLKALQTGQIQTLELLMGKDIDGDGKIGPVNKDGTTTGNSIPAQLEKQKNDILDGVKNLFRDPWSDLKYGLLLGVATVGAIGAWRRLNDQHLPVVPILVADGVVGGPEPTRRRRALVGWMPLWTPIIGGWVRPEVPHVAYVPQEAVTRLRDAQPQVLSQGDVVTIGSGENLQQITVNRVRILTRHGIGGEYRSYTLSNGREINEVELAGYAAQGALERITQAAPQVAEVGQTIGNSRVTAVDIDANSNRRYRVLENGLSNWRNEQYVTGLLAANGQPNGEHLAAPDAAEVETMANLMVVLMGQALAQMSDEQLLTVTQNIPAGAIQQVRGVLTRLGVPAQSLVTPVQVIREFDRTIQRFPEDVRNRLNQRVQEIADEAARNGEGARAHGRVNNRNRARTQRQEAQRVVAVIRGRRVVAGDMFAGRRIIRISEDRRSFVVRDHGHDRTVDRVQLEAWFDNSQQA